MSTRATISILLVLAAAACLAQETPADDDSARTAIARAAEFLSRDQNPDGSWGSHRNALLGLDDPFMNAPSQKAFTVATTGLCCVAMADAEKSPAALAAYDRGIDYLLLHHDVKRISAWDCDNTWAYVYGLQAAAQAHRSERYAKDAGRREQLAKVVRHYLERFKAYQTPLGGWGYYDAGDTTTHPPNWATSFMTAAAILALLDAREAGFEVDQALLDRSVRAVHRCRLPGGAYTYSLDIVSIPRYGEGINNLKGSLGRIQVCNLALLHAARDARRRGATPVWEPSAEELRRGLDSLFREHRFLDVARGRPIPHEAYYANAAYFYFFGHYYAARVIGELAPDQRPRYWALLRREVIKTQETDGAMVDYFMNSYGKPYGSAFGILCLLPSLEKP
jgi:hypothetical protein